MKPFAILAAVVGIFVLAACGSGTPEATPTVEVPPTVDPVLSATEGANTTSDTADSSIGGQTVTFSASVTGARTVDVAAPGRYSCLAPVTQSDSLGTPASIPGSLQISGFDAEFRQVVVNLPFDATVGVHEVDPAGGLGSYSVELTFDATDPNALYRSTDGTITLQALPQSVGAGGRVTGYFSATLTPVGSADSVQINGQFDFLTDDTSTLCTVP